MIVWGGYDVVSAHRLRVSDRGAVYNPATNRWTLLPRAPLSARTYPTAVWTGRQLLLLGGQPAVLTNTIRGDGDGAAYDPALKRWTHIASPVPPKGHGVTWVAAVQAGSQLLAWSDWSTSRRIGPNTFTEAGGVDLFAYNEQTGRWRLLPTEPNELPSVETVLWTGRSVLLRGITYNCGFCPGPFVPEATDRFYPPGNSWTRLPPDPLGSDHLLSTWTGAALVSFNASGINGPIGPGDASAYDPATRRWRRLPRAPFGCTTQQSPAWTGRQLLLYCPRSATGAASQHDGLAFTAATG
jgi:hypothetical protein